MLFHAIPPGGEHWYTSRGSEPRVPVHSRMSSLPGANTGTHLVAQSHEFLLTASSHPTRGQRLVHISWLRATSSCSLSCAIPSRRVDTSRGSEPRVLACSLVSSHLGADVATHVMALRQIFLLLPISSSATGHTCSVIQRQGAHMHSSPSLTLPSQTAALPAQVT